ncbi:MAG TPA: cupin domain-containing protein [Polyangiales bacterium]|nr:cupin domain-containing protein [Polyangiales bacterium]
MDSLTQWLEPMGKAQFVSEHLGRTPFARPGTAQQVAQCCNWQLLDDVLRAEPADVLVVAGSRQLALAAPRSTAELQGLFRRGIGIAVRAPERVSEPLAALSREFARELPGEQRLILFATPARTHGFGWHYDAEDVFVVQAAGDKEYFLRSNTISAPAVRGFQSDFREYSDETSPLMACRLLAGDWLYVPAGYWHVAHAYEDSLSLSIGVFPDHAH